MLSELPSAAYHPRAATPLLVTPRPLTANKTVELDVSALSGARGKQCHLQGDRGSYSQSEGASWQYQGAW